ncbi:orotidine 5'-phosphate decarboxylase [Leptolyngbya sp. 'hensonii']|uniref:bifunctional orotidine-5'-phosphate decarboxylase/orotate phosphoribosyltransferase n=1 Tax=Leptolyngbya sp. 'hensonii' TaxID=1922337 RepID=UPI00094FCF94|nr:bifunctional orotidine-5'-phosphate decarboxylase/orotate phosphoribosyltransferase [Leptolyngbya sp. 'hensonii']OLP18544.1 orotidine 5'-phosphate decarboxylase [Leptolyngbya sp. 'hensonii']
MSFTDKLNSAITTHASLLCVSLDPSLEMLPDRDLQGRDLIDRLWTWLQFVIQETADLVCAYKPTLGFYTALGAPGLELLQQVLAIIPPSIPIILDAKHGDLNTGTILAQTLFETWRVDAVTLSPYAGQDQAAPFLVYPGKAAFVLCCTSNPTALSLQEYPVPEQPLYLHIAREAQNWGTVEQVGLEVGTIHPELLAQIRAVAPERLILLRSLWASPDYHRIIMAGLDTHGKGLLIPVPQDILSRDRPASAIHALRQEINQIRDLSHQPDSTCAIWLPDVCLLRQSPHQDLILQLYDIGCILFGSYVQASGMTLPYYIDLRKIISNPQLFHKVVSAYAEILQGLTFDRLAGIPYGSLPTATGLALQLNCPMIYPRKEVKAHGTRRLVEGNFQPGETVVVVDDILISGNSAIEGATKLQSVGLQVRDIVVLIDHEQGVMGRLAEEGYQGHAVLTLSEITTTLYQSGRITATQQDAILAAPDHPPSP